MEFGVSFSIKQCRNFGISPEECLDWLIEDCGFRRFRLMSYWNELEPQPGEYDFAELDRQVKRITRAGGSITLCLGARQPRWPENHWPDWAWQPSKQARTNALMSFLRAVVERYKSYDSIVSYQLENEALLASFGTRPEVDRRRLRREFALIKRLDPRRPVIMTTSTSWGIPVRRPIPDIVGFSYYQKLYSSRKQAYTTALHRPWLHRLRAIVIKILWRKNCFIHELQLEPWGPKNIWEMPAREQARSMSARQIRKNVRLARKTGLKTIDLWGGEWWHWSHKQGRPEIAETVLKAIKRK